MRETRQQKIMDDFRIYCGQILFPALVRLEEERKKLVWFLYSSILLIAILAYVTFATKIPALILFLWIPIAFYFGYASYKIQQYQSLFKPRVVNLILAFIDRKMEEGGPKRALEMENRIQDMTVEINDLKQQIQKTQLQLYLKIEKQLEGIERQLDSGLEKAVLDLIRERMTKLQVEMDDLQVQISYLRRNPIAGSVRRLEEMEKEALVLEERIEKHRLTLEDGLDKRIQVMEQRIDLLEKQSSAFRSRISNSLKVEFEYEHKGKIKREDFIESHIFMAHPQVYKGEDYIKGIVGVTKFEFSELTTQRFSHSRSKMNVLFQGLFFKSQYFYDAGGLVVIIPDIKRQQMSETIRYTTQHGGGRVTVPYPDFEKVFETYATGEAKVDNLLSKSLYQAILNYKAQTDRLLYISFYKKSIYIAIEQDDDILEPNIFSSNIKYEVVERFFEDLLLLFRLVEDFDLDH